MKISADNHDTRVDILLGMSSEDVADRRNFFGASDANTLMGGDKEKIHQMWLVHTGQAEPEDLSNVLPVQMGVWTEDFNLMWFERQTGCKVTRRRAKVIHPGIPYLRATLDGETVHPDDKAVDAVVDAKHVNGFQDEEATLKKYAPQLAIQMACTGKGYGLLSILFGNFKWAWIGMPRDALYEAQVIAAIKTYWGHVQDGTPPNDLPGAEPPLPVSMMRVADMSFSNVWSDAEATYVAEEASAKAFDKAKLTMKDMVESDVREAKGRILTIKRSKSGSLTFSKTR